MKKSLVIIISLALFISGFIIYSGGQNRLNSSEMQQIYFYITDKKSKSINIDVSYITDKVKNFKSESGAVETMNTMTSQIELEESVFENENETLTLRYSNNKDLDSVHYNIREKSRKYKNINLSYLVNENDKSDDLIYTDVSLVSLNQQEKLAKRYLNVDQLPQLYEIYFNIANKIKNQDTFSIEELKKYKEDIMFEKNINKNVDDINVSQIETYIIKNKEVSIFIEYYDYKDEIKRKDKFAKVWIENSDGIYFTYCHPEILNSYICGEISMTINHFNVENQEEIFNKLK